MSDKIVPFSEDHIFEVLENYDFDVNDEKVKQLGFVLTELFQTMLEQIEEN